MKKLLLLFISITSYAQETNLYDPANSKKFAEHLLKSGQFDVAQREYERLVFIDAKNDSLNYNLLKSYRLGSKFKEGITRGQQLYQPLNAMPKPHSIEYGKMLLGLGQYDNAKTFWQESKTIDSTDARLLETTAWVLKEDFKQGLTVLNTLQGQQPEAVEDYKTLLTMAVNDDYKSPAVAGLMSAVIPSSGRFYAKDGKDAIVSLLFVASMAFQSYRGFKKSGIDSPRGWIYGGFGLGFYLGNIYGSVRSAKGYNLKKKHGYREGILQLFNSRF
jgi:tetratricopeptide (TPR) repeat protein